MTTFATLKKSSTTLDRLTKEIEKLSGPAAAFAEDTRFWYPEVDKSGNGTATIRFLPTPAVDGDDGLPWVRIFSHSFQGPGGKWYIENCLTTLGQNDPVSEFNSRLWKASNDDDSPERKQARVQKRKVAYISNIYVVSDPKKPENEGKVFLYRYGKKIFDKISQLMNPEFEGDTKVNPFHLWEGANFKLRIRTVDGYRNYDQSSFETPGVLADDAKMEEIWKKEYSLQEFLQPKQFKSYDDLKKKLMRVLEEGEETPPFKAKASEKPKPETKKPVEVAAVEDEDEDLKAFRALADD